MKIYQYYVFTFLIFNILSCRSVQDETNYKNACTMIGNYYPAKIILPDLHLPIRTERVYISINNAQIEHDSCYPRLAPQYFESPISFEPTRSGHKITVFFEPWDATAYLDSHNNPLQNPNPVRAEVYLSSTCSEEPILYKTIETNQFAWLPVYINGGPNCGADMQEGLARGEWK